MTGGAPASDGPGENAWRKLGAEAGLCAACRHAKLNETRKGTAYLRCTRAAWDPRLPRYPRLPVSDCPGFDRRRESLPGHIGTWHRSHGNVRRGRRS